MPYRIALNAHLLSLAQNYRGAGINGYIVSLLCHLPVADPGLHYTACFHDAGFQVPSGMAAYRSHWNTQGPWRRILYEQTRLALLSRQQDLFHGLAFVAPLAAACPTVITVHDLSFLRFPGAFRPLNRTYLRLMTVAATRRAAAVIAVSESTRQDVIRLCGVPAANVVTVPNGVTDEFCPAEPEAVEEFRQRHGLPSRYVLFLGTLEPRKNLVRLVDAYALWRRRERLPIKLVIAGGKGWYYEQIFARVQERGLAEDVIFPGFVPASELPWWYRAAECFIYPSVYEGFGLPVLEAMACGTPTITSTTSSLPEVAGDAALLVDAEDTAGLADALAHVLGDPILAQDLKQRGMRRAAAFSWAHTAAATAQVYRTVLEAPREE